MPGNNSPPPQSNPKANPKQSVRAINEMWGVNRAEAATWVTVTLVAIAILLICLGSGEASTAKRIPLFLAGLINFACAFAIWMLARWRPNLALPASGITFALLMSLCAHWLQIPGLFFWAAIPLVPLTLAGQGGILVVIALSLNIVFWQGNGLLDTIDREVMVVGMVALWFICTRIRDSISSLVAWTWQHYQLSQLRLDEARDRNLELDTVLEQQVHTNRQLDLLNERLAALRTRAEESQRVKAAFVAKVSHEFRTPLNMIIGLVDILIEAPSIYGAQLPGQLLEDLKIVHRNCEHLSGMINDVLDLSQTEAGRLTLRRCDGDLRDDILHAVEIVRPLAEKKGVALAVELPNAPALCSRDQTRLRQVLLNLLSNAARYTAKGTITVRLLQQPCQMRIEVADTGPGIEAADLDRIFEPFFQSGNLEGLAQKGTGLGLSISKQFVEMHGGKMGVTSAKHVGSTFWLSIPTLPADEPVVKADRWIHSEWAWHERQNRVELPVLPRQRRVILLDTIDGIHPFLDEEPEQIEVLCQETVADVVASTTTTPAHAVIVNGSTTESILPVMAELCRLVPDTPVFGWALPTPTDRARAAGALEYLVKPVTRADLVAILDTLPPVQRVLLVDDDPEVQRLLTRILYTYDETIQVSTATDVESAFQLLCTFAPGLVLLDLTLEHGTGWDLLARKQEVPTLASIPAVILSAQDPVDQPFHSPFLIASIGQGLPLASLSHGSLALMDLLLNAPSELDPAFE